MVGTKLVFFGNERLAGNVEETGVILQSLLDAGYEITALVVNQNRITSRKKKHDMVVAIAHMNDIPILTDWDEDAIKALASKADAGVLAAFGRIIKQGVIDAFPHGIINIHPSLLPEFRGTTPIESAILGGLDKTGVSIMALDRTMDAGNIYAAAEVELHGNESKQELYEQLAKLGSELLLQEMPRILSGENSGKPQDHHHATFTKMIIKSDGDINWDQPAEVIERSVRAFLGWPGSHTVLAGKDVQLTSVRILDEEHPSGEFQVINKEIVIGCRQQSLIVERLKPAGKAEMTGQAFVAGLPRIN